LPIKNLTLGLLLLTSATALAQEKTYRVKEGDTLSGIASRFDIRQAALISANNFSSAHRLKVGSTIRIPGSSKKSDRRSSEQVPAKTATYTVQSGDNDWVIAQKVGISHQLLTQLNPGTNWSRIQPGQKLAIPSAKKADTAVAIRPIRSRFALISSDDVTVRRGPSRDAGVVTTVDGGLKVAVLGKEGNWYRLQFPKGSQGWVRGDFLKSVAAEKPVAQKAAKAAVKKLVAKKKAEPKASPSPRIAGTRRLRRPATAPVQPATVAEAPVETSVAQADETEEQFSTSYVAMNTAEAPKANSQERLLKSARSFRGVRYRWGAMSRSGTDCSGFTSQVYRSIGVRLPRVSGAQATVGAPVSRNQLKKGDLVFFRTMRGKRISHVGMYIGGGKFIHASSGGGKVQIDSLSQGYYSNRFVTARRVVKASAGKELDSVVREAEKQHASPENQALPDDPDPASTLGTDEIIR